MLMPRAEWCHLHASREREAELGNKLPDERPVAPWHLAQPVPDSQGRIDDQAGLRSLGRDVVDLAELRPRQPGPVTPRRPELPDLRSLLDSTG